MWNTDAVILICEVVLILAVIHIILPLFKEMRIPWR
jgi:hypothetical protein